MGRIDSLIRRLGEPPPPRLLVDDVHKIWIDDTAPMPDLDPHAVYHVTTPRAAREIIDRGLMIPNAGRQKWGGAPASNSVGKVFVTSGAGVGRWIDMIGNTMPHLYDDVPEKLAVLQMRNPHADVAAALKAKLYERPMDDMGRRLFPTQEWSPPLFHDFSGSRDAGANAFYFEGPVPVSSTPRVRRIVSRYSVLAPLMGAGAAAMSGGAED